MPSFRSGTFSPDPLRQKAVGPFRERSLSERLGVQVGGLHQQIAPSQIQGLQSQGRARNPLMTQNREVIELRGIDGRVQLPGVTVFAAEGKTIHSRRREAVCTVSLEGGLGIGRVMTSDNYDAAQPGDTIRVRPDGTLQVGVLHRAQISTLSPTPAQRKGMYKKTHELLEKKNEHMDVLPTADDWMGR